MSTIKKPRTAFTSEPVTPYDRDETLAPLYIPTGAGTLAGFRAWATSDDFPERGRICFLDDVLFIDMSPEELETHNKVKSEVSRALGNLNRELDLGEFFSDGCLVTNEAANLSTEPDATFVTWASFEAGRVRLVPRTDRPEQYVELQGTPDLVVEIVSRSSIEKDTQRLRTLYHRAGIPEYWLIDARHDEVAFQILQRRRNSYAAVAPRDGWLRSRVFDRGFRLDRQRNRMGRWSYTLHVR